MDNLNVFFTLLGSERVKAAHKMLMILTPGINFINILRTAFTRTDPKCAKKTVKSAVSFGTFGTYGCKSCTENVDEIDPWFQCHSVLQ